MSATRPTPNDAIVTVDYKQPSPAQRKDHDWKRLFDAKKIITEQEPNTAYWDAVDFYNLLGYPDQKSFQTILEKSANDCKQTLEASKLPTGAHNHFVMKQADSKTKNKIRYQDKEEYITLNLSQYACWWIAMNSDEKQPGIAFARNYFDTSISLRDILLPSCTSVSAGILVAFFIVLLFYFAFPHVGLQITNYNDTAMIFGIGAGLGLFITLGHCMAANSESPAQDDTDQPPFSLATAATMLGTILTGDYPSFIFNRRGAREAQQLLSDETRHLARHSMFRRTTTVTFNQRDAEEAEHLLMQSIQQTQSTGGSGGTRATATATIVEIPPDRPGYGATSY